ncbi:MAG: peptidoglycan recognition family protein [Cyanobacteria bacterium P01_G01_bin.39]
MLKISPIIKSLLIVAIALKIIVLNHSLAHSRQPPSTVTQLDKTALPLLANNTDRTTISYSRTAAFTEYKPQYGSVEIHPSNYGDRYSVDAYGKPLNNQPLVVLHETTDSASSAINTFRTNHPHDNNQVSYHALITLDGTIIYLVPSNKRAFGAGNSAFKSRNGTEAVRTNPNLPASVNNFAYHISLETPLDGRGKDNRNYHSGYTQEQYKSLAWLIALSDIPEERITTHKDVDLDQHKKDPRSFDLDKLLIILNSYRQPISN